MKIVKIHGGLGNQMFQYAFAKSLENSSDDCVFIDPSAFGLDPAHNGFELGKLFHISLPVAEIDEVERLAVRPKGITSRLRRKYLTKPSHFIDKKFGYQPELLTMSGDMYYEGYWQSEKYFTKIAKTILHEFSFKLPLAERNRELLESLPRPIASIHVRRGDYLEHPNLDICTSDYYERAAKRMIEIGVSSFLVLSDDIDFCKRTLRFDAFPCAFVDWNRGKDSWQDMVMMASCDHHIIANSSFSWWGAWLGEASGVRVVAPSPWNRREIKSEDRYYSYTFGDIVPERWERLII